MPNSSDFNRFAVNPTNIDIARSLFNMNHSVKWSANIGECIPFDCIEVVPGDTLSIDTSKVIRLQPLVAPIMDEVIIDVYWFFVPHRLVWNHWINFMGENTESAWAPEVEYNIPTIQVPVGGFDVGTIADYLGVPPKVREGAKISSLPFRSYALICDQWFRSEAVMDPVHVHVDDTNRIGVNSSDQVTDIELGGKPFIACKFFDYFTGALPSPQRGDAVSFPIINESSGSINLPVITTVGGALERNHPYSAGNTVIGGNRGIHFTARDRNEGLDSPLVNAQSALTLGTGLDGYLKWNETQGTPTDRYDLFANNLWVNMRNADFNAITINDLRTAFAIQRYLERSARYGGRYQEMIKGFFNVDSPDSRLQRSEYLGGSRVSLNINSVEQTSATQSGTTPLGNVAGMSVTGDSNSDFTKSFTEHGLVIGIAVARYFHSYQQSLDKMFSRRSKYDFYNPVFANLGEQAISIDEIDFEHGSSSAGLAFGYQERWSEYRYRPNRVAGEMRSVYTTPLDMWHLGDYYTDRPYLTPEWLREDKTNLDRCLAVTSDVSNQMICDFYIECKASRPMPLYSIPGLIDHH